MAGRSFCLPRSPHRYGSQLSNGTLTLNTPNLHPDLIAKVAFDGKMSNGNAVHFEVAGLGRTFKTYLPASWSALHQDRWRFVGQPQP